MPFPQIAVVDHQRSPLEQTVLRLHQLTEADQEVVLLNVRGQVVVLNEDDRVTLTVKDLPRAVDPYILRDVEILSAPEGKIRVAIPAADLDVAGVFYAEYAIYAGTAGYPRLRVPGYMDVVQTLESSKQGVGVHIEDLRTAMYDRSAEDNFLLDDVEFTDAQICWALLKTIGLYNEMLPQAGTIYSAVDFPYREKWIEGSQAELMIMAAKNYARNDLSYQAGGTAINDKNKAQMYLQLGMQAREDFKGWAKEVKIAINMMDAISSSGSWGFDSCGG
jgi:hypothetical protein